jgi:hypothetical protein
VETKFQTSFIPKVPLNQSSGTPVKKTMSFFVFISSIIFFVSIALAGASYGYLSLLKKSQENTRVDLEKNVKAFEPATIEKYARLDNRMSIAKTLLSKHISLANVFSYLSEGTLKTVRFTNFKYDLGADGKVSLAMDGLARNYNSVAYQLQVFGKKRELKNLLVSNLSLDVTKDVVLFKLGTEVDPAFTYYSSTLGKKQDIFDNNLGDEPLLPTSASSTSRSSTSTPPINQPPRQL